MQRAPLERRCRRARRGRVGAGWEVWGLPQGDQRPPPTPHPVQSIGVHSEELGDRFFNPDSHRDTEAQLTGPPELCASPLTTPMLRPPKLPHCLPESSKVTRHLGPVHKDRPRGCPGHRCWPSQREARQACRSGQHEGQCAMTNDRPASYRRVRRGQSQLELLQRGPEQEALLSATATPSSFLDDLLQDLSSVHCAPVLTRKSQKCSQIHSGPLLRSHPPFP